MKYFNDSILSGFELIFVYIFNRYNFILFPQYTNILYLQWFLFKGIPSY